MGKPESPCQYCEDRYRLCHSYCERYKEYRRELDKWNEMDIREKKKARDYCDFVVRSIDHNFKRHGKRARRRGKV